MPQGEERKVFLDADVLEAAHLSCNLAKAMPAVLCSTGVSEMRGRSEE